jgi:hypothetical protein
MTMKLTDMGRFSAVVLAGLLAACTPSAPDTASTTVISPTASPTAVSNPIAKISEIQKLPVFVRLLNTTQEEPAKEGMGLQVGETIRTQGQALTQIDLDNGLAFRLAGDAVLKLQHDNRLNLTAGDMITWVQPGKKLPTEIITPTAVAGIRGTTVFVKIPKDPKEGVLFFAWEGAVAVRLTGQTEEVLLKTAEEVRIRPGDRDIRLIRQRVRRMSRAEWRQKRATDPILRSFKKAQMTTLPIIDRIQPGQLVLPTSSASPRQAEMKAAGSQKLLKVENLPTAEKPLKADKPPKAEKPPKVEKLSKPGKPPKAEKQSKAEKLSKAEKPGKPDKPPKQRTALPRGDAAFRKPASPGKPPDTQDRSDRAPKPRDNKPKDEDRDDRDRSQKPRSKGSDG